MEQRLPSIQQSTTSAIICNPLLLSVPFNDKITINSNDSSTSTNNEFNSSMHINRIFNEEEYCNNDDIDEHREENNHLLISTRSLPEGDTLTTSTPQFTHSHSDTRLVMLPEQTPPTLTELLLLQNQQQQTSVDNRTENQQRKSNNVLKCLLS